VRAQVLDIDVEKERISLGIKQLAGDPFADAGEIKKGQVVTCEVLEVKDSGLEVKIVDTDLSTFIRRAELARDRGDQRPERFAPGEKLDARVTQFDRKARRVTLSVKALEMAEEKEAIAQYGSTDSGRLARRHPGRGAEEGRHGQEVASAAPVPAPRPTFQALRPRKGDGAASPAARRRASRTSCRSAPSLRPG
jgi:predicted RNA-binding protein with RPS1 domain